MLPHAGDEDRLLPAEPRKRLDDLLAFQPAGFAPVSERLLPLPAGDRLQPRAAAGVERLPVQQRKRLLHIGGKAEAGTDILIDLRLVDIDMDDESVFSKPVRAAGRTVREPCAEHQQQVAFVHRVIRVIRTVHAEPLQRKRVRLRE